MGAHTGAHLKPHVPYFDAIYAFEADPNSVAILRENFKGAKNVVITHAAVCEQDGPVVFNIASNGSGSSSLGSFSPDWIANRTDDLRMTHQITVPGINLARWLMAAGVKHIDLYVSDLQGMDLSVLSTLDQTFIKPGKISAIQCETTKDGKTNIYEGLGSNEFKDIGALLDPYYEHVASGWGELEMGKFIPVDDDWWEFDTLWLSRDVIHRPLAPGIAAAFTKRVIGSHFGGDRST